MLKPMMKTPAVPRWEKPADMPDILYEMLRLRGIGDIFAARAFLNPDISQLLDPFLLSDMRKAVDQINKSVEAGERVCVWGDYDVDGVCACAILTGYLKSRGVNADAYLPSRHSEGYGLNESAVKKIAETHELLITVDCGITAVALTDLAQEIGLKTIVTDHHKPEGELPHCPTVNPLLNGYPFPHLCGAGVAFKLVCALGGVDAAMEYIDFAALATIADIVPLTGENRVISSAGLKRINRAPRAGVRALIEASGLGGRELFAGNVAFQITPRLNAGGRIGSAMRAYDLLTCARFDECTVIADELNSENAYRKALEQKVISDAEEMLKSFDFVGHRAIIVAGEGWNAGVIGLAASRFSEKYHYPTIVISKDGDVCTGSCRSIDGIDIHAALANVSLHLVRFGGHKMAAGLQIKAENIEAFASALDEYLKREIPDETYLPKIEYDLRVDPSTLTDENISALNALAPTGCGNPAPLFLMNCGIYNSRRVGADGAHLKMTLRGETDAIGGIWFRNGDKVNKLPARADCLFAPSVSEYQGRRYVQAEMREILPASPEACLSRDASRAERLFQSFLTQHVYNRTHIEGKLSEISAAELKTKLKQRCQGVLIVAASIETARAALRLLDGADLDVYSGEYPSDARCFNALCLSPVGERNKGYDTVVAAGIPRGLISAGRALSGVPACELFGLLPNVDVLRLVYSRLRNIVRNGNGSYTSDALSEICVNDLNISSATVAFSLSALKELELIIEKPRDGGVYVEVPPVSRRDPSESRIFSIMAELRAFANVKGG